VSVALALASAAAGCSDEPTASDAAVDAVPAFDAYYVCDVPVQLCPAERPFCCWNGCLECLAICVAEPVDICEESPTPSDADGCDPESDPTGCPLERPVCCMHLGDGATFCVDHVLSGADWQCGDASSDG
jgi:hypothetical protein